MIRQLSGVLLLSVSVFACAVPTSGGDDEPTAADEALASASKDASLAKLLKKVGSDGRLEFSESDAIVSEVLRGGMTSSTLRAAVTFLQKPPADLEKRADGRVDARNGGLNTLENMYFGMPRNIGGLTGSGQSVVESTSETSTEYFFGEMPEKPVTVRFVGTARKAYNLSFRVYEQPISVAIPAGATAADSAARLAQALNANQQAIIDSANDSRGIRFDSDTFLTELHADATGDTVDVALSEDS